MAPIHNQSTRDALLFWLNSAFRDGQDPITSMAALTDGVTLLAILKAVDPEFVDYSTDDRDPTRNLLALRKGLVSAFHRDNLDHLESMTTQIDIHSITERTDQNQTAELVTLLMCLSVTGPNQEQYVTHITGVKDVNPEAFKEIGRLANSRLNADSSANEEAGEEVAPVQDSLTDQDRVLHLEAAMAKAHTNLDRAKKEHAETLTRLEMLRAHHEDLKNEAKIMQEENQWLKESETRGTVDAQQIRDLKKRTEEQDATIVNLEERCQELEEAHEKISREQVPLREKAARAFELEDVVQELRYQNAELEKKSNAAENYKKKIMQQRDLHGENMGLKRANQELHDQLDAKDRALKDLPRLQEVESRFQTMLQSYETQISDLTDHKKSLEHYIRDAERKIELSEEQRSHDEKYINEMRDQLLQGSHAHTTGGANGAGEALSLEQELEGNDNGDGAGDDGESNVPASLQISRLKAENIMLRGTMTSQGEVTHLRVDLEAAENAKARLQQKYNEIFEQNAVTQEQMKALVDNMAGEDSIAFATMRREKEEATREYSKLKKTVQDLQAQVTDKERELLSTKTDLAAVEKDSLSALEELKSTDQLIANSARSDLAILQQKHSDLQQEHQSQQGELIKTFLIKEKLTQELAEAKEMQEKSQDKMTSDKVEKSRQKARHYKEQLEKVEQEKYDLQRTLKTMRDGGFAEDEKAALMEKINNLKLENDMIATAWYDMTNRLQSNHVVLQRRQDAPKSWINKQRHMVNATPRR